MTKMPTIDLNCDMGESFGCYSLGNDSAIMPFISSANIACGMHAGDPSVMAKTVRSALEHGVAVGAHPGFADLQGFGRRNMSLSPEEVHDLVLYQIGALQAFVKAEGSKLHHVKPHGALYNMAAQDSAMAKAIAEAVYRFDADLILYGLSGSELVLQAEKLGLKTASEVFADRSYLSSGQLMPRAQEGAVIKDQQTSLGQVRQLVIDQQVMANNGNLVNIKAETVCIHGDGANALAFTEACHHFLSQEGITIQAP